MENRINTLFNTKKNNILSLYITAGFPNLDDTTRVIDRCVEAGVDMIEIGFPFSDPLADGPTIQKSSQIAIENGMNLSLLFQQLNELRERVNIPIVLMGYLNPVLQYGEHKFLEDCQRVGIDGIIIPDLPISYYKKHFKPLCDLYHISNILLITPQTPDDRIREIDTISNGFIYMVSSNSITGSKNSLSHQISYFERIQKMNLENPTIIGFGIHDKETFERASTYSSGAIIGSAFIKHIEKEGISSHSIQSFVNNIKL